MPDFDWNKYLPALQAGGSWLGGLLLLVILKRSIRYHIGGRCLVIKLLWIVPVRWISFANIRHLGTGTPFWSERWGNGFFKRTDRVLHIRKRRGWLFRDVLITPEKRFEFKAALENARATVTGGSHRRGSLRSSGVTPDPVMRQPEPASPAPVAHEPAAD